MAKDAAHVADKWARRLKGAVEDIRVGVEAVTESPTEKAAAKKAKWIARLTSKEVQDKWEAALKAVSLEDWKKAMVDKGLGRIAAGVDEAQSDFEAFMRDLLPHIEAGRSKIRTMPDVTLEDNIRRMETFIRHMATFRRKR